MSHLNTLPEISSLPRSEFAYPGPLRDKLIAAILSEKKTTTTGVMAEYTLNNEPLPKPGNMEALIDSQEDAIAVLQMVEVRSCTLKEVDLQHVIDEEREMKVWLSGEATMKDSGTQESLEKICMIRDSQLTTTRNSS